jgi:hypothetical protein
MAKTPPPRRPAPPTAESVGVIREVDLAPQAAASVSVSAHEPLNVSCGHARKHETGRIVDDSPKPQVEGIYAMHYEIRLGNKREITCKRIARH